MIDPMYLTIGLLLAVGVAGILHIIVRGPED